MTPMPDPLSRNLAVEFIGREKLDRYLTRLNLAEGLASTQLEQEFRALLYRVLRKEVGQVSLYPLPLGQSGAGVLRADLYYGTHIGAPLVLKVGKTRKIKREWENFHRDVDPFVSEFSSKLDSQAFGPRISLLAYQLIGGDLNKTISFAYYYARHNPDKICQTLDRLFRQTCGRWYMNREQPRRMHNLVTLYQAALNIEWEKVWAGAAATGVDLNTESLQFPGLAGTFPNPKKWLERQAYTLYRPVFRAITHGDLHEDNILVTEDGAC